MNNGSSDTYTLIVFSLSESQWNVAQVHDGFHTEEVIISGDWVHMTYEILSDEDGAVIAYFADGWWHREGRIYSDITISFGVRK
jgi:hypothetical protein